MTPTRTKLIDISFTAGDVLAHDEHSDGGCAGGAEAVQAAQAGPTSNDFNAIVSSPKLIKAHAAQATVGQKLVIPWLSLRKAAKPFRAGRRRRGEPKP